MTKPEWLTVRSPSGERFELLKRTLHEYDLNTVCRSANCPNIGICWSCGCATFMIMGSVCTRHCRFCSVKKRIVGEPLDPSEPERIAAAVKKIRLKHVVLTSVDRDDLPDGGAEHFGACIEALKQLKGDFIIEVLIPDFSGKISCLNKIIRAGPEIIGHNIETTREFQALLRDRRAGYDLSLEVLGNIKKICSSIRTKSSIMLGFGESEDMVIKTLLDLRHAGVDLITIGQYLRPTIRHLEVKEYVPPEKFEYYKKKAEDIGFLSVTSGPLVRSSYAAFIK